MLYSRVKPLFTYALSLPLVALTTWGLFALQQAMTAREGVYTRPYAIGFILPVALMTLLGGARAGVLTLALSLLSTVYILVEPTFAFELYQPRDVAEVVIVGVTGSLIVFSLDAMRRAHERSERLLADSRESSARLRTVMNTAPVAVMTCTPDGTLNYANREAERIWGQPLHTVSREGWSRYRLLYPDGSPIPPERMGLARALAGEDPVHNELTIERPDGTRVMVSSISTRVHDQEGELLGALAVFSDVSERKSAEEALRQSEENYRFLAETMPQLVWTALPDGGHDYFNARWFEYTGTTPEETRGSGWSRLLHPDDQERSLGCWEHCLRTGDPYEIEYRFRRAEDGMYRWFLARALPLRGPDGRILRWFGTCTDIHDQKVLEEERARLLQEVQRRAEMEALANKIGQALRVDLDPEYVQSVATEALGEALNVDRCYFATFDLAHDQVVIGQDWRRADLPSLAGEYRISDFRIDLEALYGTGATQVTQDVRTDPDLGATAAAFEALGLRAGITVPLMDEGRPVASLSVAMADAPRPWTPEEAALVETVASQTWSTMNAAILLQRERNIAVRLQEALRPRIPEGTPGLDLAEYYQPALAEANIGGDFFDVFAIEKGCTALVVGDLSGKGLAAASQVALVRNMLRFALYQGSSAARALESLNGVLCEHGLLVGFATLFVGLHDTGAGTLTYVSCGHEPGLVRRARAGVIEELPPTGPILGGVEDARYEQHVVNLGPGDVLALYTDGLSEAGRARHQFLGVEGIAGLLREAHPGAGADAIKERIMSGVERHAGGHLDDDACLLVAVIAGKG